MKIIGIDPGLSGGIAVLENNKVLNIFDMPVMSEGKKNKITEEEAFEIAINAGAKDCLNLNDNFEIITKKEDFYKIKTELEKKIDTFSYSAIEWRALSHIELNKEQSEKILEILSSLEELDDVQNIFTNANLEKIQI